MATKTEIQNLIDVNLADESDIIAEAHREVENAFVDELYPDIFTDTKDTPPQKILCLQPEKISGYKIISSKSGNMVTLQVSYTTSDTVGFFSNLFQIIDENFTLPVGQILNIPTYCRTVNNNPEPRLSTISGNKITATNWNNAGSFLCFSITYRAK